MDNLTNFFFEHPIFRREELIEFYVLQGKSEKKARDILNYHLKNERAVNIRRSLYVALNPGQTKSQHSVNPYLVAAKATEDSVLAYQTALQYYGLNYSTYSEYLFLTNQNSKDFNYLGIHYKALPHPKALVEQQAETQQVTSVDIDGLVVRITTLERTLVDAINKPKYAGGLEELCYAFYMAKGVDTELMLEYALLLNNKSINAKLGFFLELYQKEFHVSDQLLNTLASKIPKDRRNLDINKLGKSIFLPRWNLVVPKFSVDRDWEHSK